jgi:hypothetical protein
LRVAARPGLKASLVVRQGDYRPLAITKDYDVLTSESGPLASLAPLVRPGPHELRVAGPVDSGNSWELPVLLAHLAVALGAELAAEPAKADLVLWSTGAVDLDLHILDHDYKLAAKADCSRGALKEAVAASARIVAILPAGTDASPLRDVLAQAGAQHAQVELITNVSAARCALEDALRSSSIPQAAAPLPPGPGTSRFLRSAVGATVLVAATALASPAGRDPVGAAIDTGVKIADGGQRQADPQEQARTGTSTGTESQPDSTPAESTKPAEPEHTAPSAPADPPAPASSSAPAAPSAPTSPSAPTAPPPAAAEPPVPVQLAELRDPKGRGCFSVLYENLPPLKVDVPLEGKDRFRASTGRNLCGVELTLNPQSRAQGFDIDLRQQGGVVLTPAGGPGARTKIKVEFKNDLRHTITYNVLVKFGDGQPSEPIRFQHTIN